MLIGWWRSGGPSGRSTRPHVGPAEPSQVNLQVNHDMYDHLPMLDILLSDDEYNTYANLCQWYLAATPCGDVAWHRYHGPWEWVADITHMWFSYTISTQSLSNGLLYESYSLADTIHICDFHTILTFICLLCISNWRSPLVDHDIAPYHLRHYTNISMSKLLITINPTVWVLV